MKVWGILARLEVEEGRLPVALQPFARAGEIISILSSRNLWIFVSKFTEFDARRPHEIYEMACEERL